jgi:hypothetical protein
MRPENGRCVSSANKRQKTEAGFYPSRNIRATRDLCGLEPVE